MTTQHQVRVAEGSVVAIPVTAESTGIAVISRLASRGRPGRRWCIVHGLDSLIPSGELPKTKDLRVGKTLCIGREIDLPIVSGAWQVLPVDWQFSRSEWPLPVFADLDGRRLFEFAPPTFDSLTYIDGRASGRIPRSHFPLWSGTKDWQAFAEWFSSLLLHRQRRSFVMRAAALRTWDTLRSRKRGIRFAFDHNLVDGRRDLK